MQTVPPLNAPALSTSLDGISLLDNKDTRMAVLARVTRLARARGCDSTFSFLFRLCTRLYTSYQATRDVLQIHARSNAHIQIHLTAVQMS